MSRLRFNKVADPSTPAVGKTEFYYATIGSGIGTPAPALVAIDENGTKARLAGFAVPDYRLIKVTHILNPTTSYTPTAGTRALLVECFGGGGAGGGGVTGTTATSAGTGGGGGAYSTVWLSGAQIKTPFTVAVGAGGTPGAAGNNPGGVGGDTTFDTGPSVCTAKGGSGGLGGGVAAITSLAIIGGAGGLASGGLGDQKYDGVDGGYSLRLAAAIAISGRGGDGPLVGGGGQEIVDAQGAGLAGTIPGGGGSGGIALNGGASVAGGAGANGLIRVWEYA